MESSWYRLYYIVQQKKVTFFRYPFCQVNGCRIHHKCKYYRSPPPKKIQPAKIHLYFKHTFFSVLFHEGLLPQCIVSQIKYQVSFRFYKMIEVMLFSALPQVKEMYQRVGKILLNYEHISFRANTFSLLIHGLCWAWEITPKTKVRWLL